MSSITWGDREWMHSAISASERRNDGGDHLSNFCEYSRTAFSPLAAMLSRMLSTVLRTCNVLSAFIAADWPLFKYRIILSVLLSVYFLAGAGSGGGSGAGFS